MNDPALKTALPDILRQADNLPSLPAVAVEVLRLSRSEETTGAELAKAIGPDPALSAKLLKLSNSAMFNPGANQVRSLEQAVITLGMKTVKLMSLSFSLAARLPRASSGDVYDLRQFWRRSLTAAVAGRAFGLLVKSRCADEAFTCGLFSRLGQLVLFQCMPEQFAPVLAEAGERLPTCELEERHLGFDHALAGYALLKAWGLPRELYEVVGFMNKPASLPPDAGAETRETCALAHVAELCCRVLCDEEKGAALTALLKLCADRHALTGEMVDAFLVSIQAGTRETADLLSLDIPTPADHAEIVNEARMQIVKISLDTTMHLQQSERRAHVLETTNRELKDLAQTDKLTALGNRAYFDQALANELVRRQAGGVPLTLGLLMLDIDHFKRFNDTYGHQTGDEVLKLVGKCIREYCRDTDLPARYGGEEFAVIAPETSPDELRVLAERLRFRIAQQRLEFEGEQLSITVSIGGACIAEVTSERDGQSLVKVADHHLYQAKKRGRNRCEFYAKSQLPRRED